MIANLEAIKESISIEKVIGKYVELKREGHHYIACCPFHQEKTPSFTVTPDKGIYKCFGSCGESGDVISFVEKIENKSFADAVRIVADYAGVPVRNEDGTRTAPLKPGDIAGFHPEARRMVDTAPAPPQIKAKLVATYPYTDANGDLVYEVLRYEPGRNGKKKDFLQRRPFRGAWAWALNAGWYEQSERGDWRPTKAPQDGAVELGETQRVLWKLHELVTAEEVAITEGERDAETMSRLGFVATTNSGGSKQPWLPEYSEALRGKRVIIFPDNDAAGEAHGRKIETALKNVASELVYVSMPRGFKDITEFVESGRTADDVQRLISNTESALVDADQRRRGLLSPIEAISRTLGGIPAFLDPSLRPQGLQTGFIKFDEMTLGLHRDQLITLAGRPGMGKTTIGLNIAHNIARQRQKAVAIFSLEMSSESLLDRMGCAAARIDSLRFRAGYCSPRERADFADAIADINDLPIRFDDYTPLTLDELERKLDLFSRDNDLGLVVIDYLQLMSNNKSSKAGNRANEVSEQSRGIKLLAKKYRCPFLLLAQLSRACELRPGDHRPILSDLRDSGSIEQDSDVVVFAYRQEVYRPDLESARGIAELIIGKQRSGPTGRVKLAFQNRFNLFENLAYDVGEAYGPEE